MVVLFPHTMILSIFARSPGVPGLCTRFVAIVEISVTSVFIISSTIMLFPLPLLPNYTKLEEITYSGKLHIIYKLCLMICFIIQNRRTKIGCQFVCIGYYCDNSCLFLS